MRRGARLAGLLCGLLLVSGCSSFQGPGSLQTGVGAFVTPDQYDIPPRSAEVPAVVKPRNPGPFVLRWPVNNVRITQHFSPTKNRKHQGIDLGGRRGTPIFAAHEGMVVYAGRDFRGYGKMVLIEYDSEWASLYAHMQTLLVREGQYVERGQTIGTMGRTGRSTGVHLHFELIRNKQTIDPVPLLNSSGNMAYTPNSPFREHIIYRRGEESLDEVITD